MKKICLLLSVFFFSINLYAQYTPTSPYLISPDKAIGYVDSCAFFWLRTYDHSRGGFYTNIDKVGNVILNWGTNKNMLTQSRNAYGLTRAYMITGDTAYLNLAGKALNWMYAHAWDTTYGGWFQELDINGNPVNPSANKTAFYQHYALLGISAYYEATGDTTAWHYLMKGYQHLENYFWDTRNQFEGYYDLTDFNNLNPRNKSFNATVDAITTHLLYLYLMTREEQYKEKLLEIASEIKDHLVASMPSQAIGFVEHFDSDWNYNNSETMTLMGHVLKTGWCLARIEQLFPEADYLAEAETLVTNVWQKGYDHVYGGPYKDFNRITGQMLLWGLGDSAKAWWQMEQAIVAGLQLYNLTGKPQYLQMADETISFFMNFFVDRVNGEVYADRKRRGGLAWNEAKGSSGKAGYHSIELGYYTYLYGNIFYTYDPVVLHYNFAPHPESRQILLNPIAGGENNLVVQQVLLNGQNYDDYSGFFPRALNIPAGVSGHFEVTYAPQLVSVSQDQLAITEYRLEQNYPNPFNPVTTIKYNIPARSNVTLKVYDILGKELAVLINGITEAGPGTVQFDGSGLSSGVYFVKLESENFIQSRKMILLK